MKSEPDATRTSRDGVDYGYVSIPDDDTAKVTYDIEEFAGDAEISDDGYQVYHLYIKCNEVSRKGLPLEANPREPSRTKQVQAMQETLKHNPDDFVKKNNGIVMFANNVTIEDETEANIKFSQNEGICNGGHTYFAMKTYEEAVKDKLSDEAIVHLETIILPPDVQGQDRRKAIIDIAGARNNNNQLESRTEADFLGYYDEFKSVLNDTRFVSWHEGDSKAYDDAFNSVHLIRLLKCFDIFAYYHPAYNDTGSSHKALATSKSRTHSRWIENMDEAKRENTAKPLHYLIPVIDDILKIRDKLSHSFQWEDLGSGFRNSGLYRYYLAKGEHTERDETPAPEELKQGERRLRSREFEHSVGIDLKQTLEVMFIGLFRSNLYVSPSIKSEVEYTGWFVEPIQLWDDQKEGLVDRMKEFFNDVEKDPKQFIRTTAPFSQDLFEVGYKREPPNPEILYHRELQKHRKGEPYSVTKYELSPEEDGEFVLVDVPDSERQELQRIDDVSTAGTQVYRQTGTFEVKPN